MPFALSRLLIIREAFYMAIWEWNVFGFYTGQAVLNRLWVKIVKYDNHLLWRTEGSQFNLSWTDFFQLGRRWLLVSQERPEEGSVFKALYNFFRLVYQISAWFLSCKMYSIPAKAQVFPWKHADFTTLLNEITWQISQTCSGAGWHNEVWRP